MLTIIVSVGRSRANCKILISIALAFVGMLVGNSVAQAVTESVIYGFKGDFGLIRDGANAYGEILAGPNGVYYGTTSGGGDIGCIAGGGWFTGCGTVYMLARGPNGWIEKTILTFHGINGAVATGNLVTDAQGDLYGTTVEGGNMICPYGCGTVYELSPPAPGGQWTQTVLYSFQGGHLQGGVDGWQPRAGLYMDGAGNLFGTTALGGPNGCWSGSGCGIVFELTPSANGTWGKSTIYSFQGGNDGAEPYGRLIARGSVLYGTTSGGLNDTDGKSTAFSLTNAGGWRKTVLHIFTGGANDGDHPTAGLYMDVHGNLFGTTYGGGASNHGIVFELSPAGVTWGETIVHSFDAPGDGSIPVASLTPGLNGVLYGTTVAGGQYGLGTVFTLALSAGHWTENILHSFGAPSDAAEPFTGVTVLPNGSVLGTSLFGGYSQLCSGGCGTIYELQ
jgi:uncharacterized repeat protein (TIGR03803 family)